MGNCGQRDTSRLPQFCIVHLCSMAEAFSVSTDDVQNMSDEFACDGSDKADHRGQTSNTSNRRTSLPDVYSFILEDPVGSGSFYCQCCKDISKSTKWKNRSTSNFRRHLTKEQYDRYVPQDASQTKPTRHGFVRLNPQSGSKRMKVASDFGPSDKIDADDKLTDWIVNDSQSFSVVEQNEFLAYCNTLRS
jgi:hypothetical protein